MKAKKITEKLAQLLLSKEMTTPHLFAPDEYEHYVPSFSDDPRLIGSAVNRQPRWIGKGDLETKGLGVEGGGDGWQIPNGHRVSDAEELLDRIDNALDKA